MRTNLQKTSISRRSKLLEMGAGWDIRPGEERDDMLFGPACSKSNAFDPSNCVVVSKLRSRWNEMIKIAREFKILRFAPAEINRMRIKLQRLTQRINTELLDMAAIALCGFFLSDYPIITAVYRRDIILFKKYCCCTTKRDFNNDDRIWWAKVTRLWSLLKSTLLPVLSLTRKTLPVSVEPLVLFRGVSFKSLEDLNRFLSNIKSNGSLTQVKSWTNSLEVATQYSDPNRGLLGRMNLMQRRLIRRGLKDNVTTNLGVVLVTVATGISVEQLALKTSEKEWWLTGEDDELDMQVTNDKDEIETLLWSLTPKMAQRDIEKLSNSG